MRALFERLSPDYWWSDPTVSWDGLGAVVFAVVLAAVFVGAAATLALSERLQSVGRLPPQDVRMMASWALGLAATGLLLLLFRWQMTPFFGRRLWFFLWLVASAAVVATSARAALGTLRRSSSSSSP